MLAQGLKLGNSTVHFDHCQMINTYNTWLMDTLDIYKKVHFEFSIEKINYKH